MSADDDAGVASSLLSVEAVEVEGLLFLFVWEGRATGARGGFAVALEDLRAHHTTTQHNIKEQNTNRTQHHTKSRPDPITVGHPLLYYIAAKDQRERCYSKTYTGDSARSTFMSSTRDRNTGNLLLFQSTQSNFAETFLTVGRDARGRQQCFSCS